MTKDRDCKNCKHYVVTDVKHNYEMNGCGMYDQKIYGCEKWECEFEAKTTFCVAPECDQCVLSDTEKCPDRLKAESEGKEA